MSRLKTAVSFLLGTVIGSGVTFLVSKAYFKKKCDEEVNEYRQTIVNANRKVQNLRNDVAQSEAELAEAEETQPAVKEVSKDNDTSEAPEASDLFSAKELSEYTDYAHRYGGDTLPEQSSTKTINGPYPIDPDEYGSVNDYEQVHFTLYKDGVLADDNDDVVDGYQKTTTVGDDFAAYFGEYSDDAVWLRNDDTKCEYEIERSLEPYYGG